MIFSMVKQANSHISAFTSQMDFLSVIAEKILANEDLNSTIKSLADTLRIQLKAFSAGIFLYDEEANSLYLRAFSETNLASKAMNLFLKNYTKYRLPINDKKMLASICIKEKKIVDSLFLSDFCSPVVPKKILDSIQKMTRLKYCIAIPVIAKEKAVGVLFVVFQRPKITPYELSLLKFCANLSGLGIENSRKRDEAEKKYQIEKETTALLSHELKTPIAIAYNSAQMYRLLLDKNSGKLGPMFKDFEEVHEDVKNSVNRLNQICTSIFSLMEVEKTKDVTLHKLDLEHHLGQVIANFKRKAEEKGLQFKSDFKFRNGNYYGGGVQLEQILTVLVDNAIKYTKSGQIEVGIEQKENKIACSVSDTGCGIPKNKRQVVFERFYRHKSLKNKYLHNMRGLGLGLYVAQQIVNKLDGKIEIGDNPGGRGSRFTVEIPVYKKLPKKSFSFN
jgi:signal transduction histidine kinase